MIGIIRGWDTELSREENEENAERMALNDREAVAHIGITLFADGAVIEYEYRGSGESYITAVRLKEGQTPDEERAAHNAVTRLFREIRKGADAE